MFVFENPTDETVTRVIAAQADADYSYDGVGTTADPTKIPPGYLVDRYRVRLGSGDADETELADLNGFCYHQQWLHNLLIAASLNGVNTQTSPHKIRWG